MRIMRLYARRFNCKRAQLQIQETAFMLLALAFLFTLVFIFYSNFQIRQLYSEKNR